MMRLIWLAMICGVPTAACQASLYGEGSVYVWNGTDSAVNVTGEGRTPLQAMIRVEYGKLFPEVVAGDYAFTAGSGAAIKTKVDKDRLTVVNLGSTGCFARTDVAGMYKRGRDAVRVLETYIEEETILLENDITVLPGHRLPAQAPMITNETVLQRFAAVPCNLAKHKDADGKVAEFVRRLK